MNNLEPLDLISGFSWHNAHVPNIAVTLWPWMAESLQPPHLALKLMHSRYFDDD